MVPSIQQDVRPRGLWFDRWLVSEADEELESIGVERRGREIIEELNRVYASTGVLERMLALLAEVVRRAYAGTGKPVRVLELSTRDGTLLHLLQKVGHRSGIPLDLHGLEFRPDIADYARQRCKARGDHITVHCDPSKCLDGLEPGSFDVVFSTFMIHHRTPAQCALMLVAANEAARFGAYHLDLRRSLIGLALTWLFLTLRGFSVVKRDSVLSVRRAFRPQELARLISDTKAPLSVRSLGLMYLLVEPKAIEERPAS